MFAISKNDVPYPSTTLTGGLTALPKELIKMVCAILDQSRDHKGLVAFAFSCKAVYNLVYECQYFTQIRGFIRYCSQLPRQGQLEKIESSFRPVKRVVFEQKGFSDKLYFSIACGLETGVLVTDSNASKTHFFSLTQKDVQQQTGNNYFLDIIPYRNGMALIHSTSISLWKMNPKGFTLDKVCSFNKNYRLEGGSVGISGELLFIRACHERTDAEKLFVFSTIKQKVVKTSSHVNAIISNSSLVSFLPLQYFEKKLQEKPKENLLLLTAKATLLELETKLSKGGCGLDYGVNAKWVVGVGKSWVRVIRRDNKKLWFTLENLKEGRKPRFHNPTLHLLGDFLLIYEKSVKAPIDLMVIYLPAQKVLLQKTPPVLAKLQNERIEHIDLLQEQPDLFLTVLTSSGKTKKGATMTLYKLALSQKTGVQLPSNPITKFWSRFMPSKRK